MGLAVTSDGAPIVERGLVSMSEVAWEQARQRAAVIAPLAALGSVSHRAADAAGGQLGLSRRQVYVLVGRYRQGSGLVTDLARGGPMVAGGVFAWRSRSSR